MFNLNAPIYTMMDELHDLISNYYGGKSAYALMQLGQQIGLYSDTMMEAYHLTNDLNIKIDAFDTERGVSLMDIVAAFENLSRAIGRISQND